MTNQVPLLILLMCAGTLAHAKGEELTAQKLRELERLPVGLEVVHLPARVFAIRGGPSGRPYTWVHSTSVASSKGTVTVKEFGAFIWSEERWVFSTYTGKPFTSKDFVDWYACPGASVKPGRTCTDKSNWTGSSEPRDLRTRWYFIGSLKNGKLVKGEAVVEELPLVLKK